MMSGQTCIVTGATAGLGEVTARELVRGGATVVVVGRTWQRCEATVKSIRKETGNHRVEFLCGDLSSQSEVRRLAAEFLCRHDRLHVLVNNAGALFALRQESVDGIEMTLALNHLAPFLLTNLLLGVMKASASSRIVNVTSAAHEDVAGFHFDDPQARTRGMWAYPRSEFASLLYSLAMPWAHPGFVQYAQTKLANLLFTYELARRLSGTGVTANALHPGLVASNFMAGNGVYGWFMRRWARLRGISMKEAAKTSLYLAMSPQVEGVSGQYFVNQRAVQSSVASTDEAAAQRLWELSEELTGLQGMP